MNSSITKLMSNQKHQEVILCLLQKLRGLDPHKELCWSVLNYERASQIHSRCEWPNAAGRAIADHALITFLVHPTKAHFLKSIDMPFLHIFKISMVMITSIEITITLGVNSASHCAL